MREEFEDGACGTRLFGAMVKALDGERGCMDAANMTIEGFFLQDYVRQKEENECLKARVDNLEKELEKTQSGYGVFDLKRKTETVRYDVQSSYYIRNYFKYLTEDKIIDLLELDDESLYKKAIDTWSKESYGSSPLIKRTTVTYQYTIRIKETRCDDIAYFDKVDQTVKKLRDEVDVDCEVPIAYDADAKKMAIDVLRDTLTDRLEELEKERNKSEKEGENDVGE